MNNLQEIVGTDSVENIEHEIYFKKKVLKPSIYMKKMQASTCQWLESQKMKSNVNKNMFLQNQCSSNQKPPMFQPFPKKLVFKNFMPNSTSCLPLTFRNLDMVSRCLKVIMEESPHFKLVSPLGSSRDGAGRIGAGLLASYKVLFTPGENKDYRHCISYYCDGCEFKIAIKAIGPRAILDVPDRIDFPMCPVKYLSSKTIFVKNVGTCAMCFTLNTISPFSVNPKSGLLDVNGNMQMTIDFHPMFIGNHCNFLTLKYETGEEVCIELFGMCDDIAIRLERSILKMDNTYTNMITTKNVSLLNRSNIIASFKWTAFSTRKEEEMNQTMLSNHSELLKDDTFCVSDTTDQLDMPDETQLHGTTMHVDPLEGHIWPNSSLAMKISFSPSKPGEWKKMIYCDVEGRESRLPLNVEGFAFGPTLELSHNYLEIGSVPVSSKNLYEVVLSNKGPISADFCINTDPSDLGSCFKITPMKGTVKNGCSISLQISFSRNVVGPFVHAILLRINDSSEPMILNISGSIQAPSFKFDVEHLEFENISIGFDKMKTFNITNLSDIPFEFKLHVGKDEHEKFPTRTDNEVFEIEPSEGTLDPQSEVEVTVRFRPKLFQSYNSYVVFNIVDIKSSAFMLPIKARCVMPVIKVLTPLLIYNSIPINFPVTKNIRVQNDSEVSGKFTINKLETNLLSCFSSSNEGIVDPLTCCNVPLTVIAKTTAEVQDSINIHLIGFHVPFEVKIKFKGEGPVVTLSHNLLDWGNVPVLKQISKSLTIYNHSPIPARFEARMAKKTNTWKVNPMEGMITSDGKIFLDLTVNLNDSLSFSNSVEVVIERSTVLSCTVKAQGKGSTIVFDSELMDGILLGPQLCNSNVSRSFEIANCGRRTQIVTFKIMQLEQQQQQSAVGPCDLSLKILPSRLELLPGMKSEITVMCSSKVPCYSEKTVMCQTIVGTGSPKEKVREFQFLCHFVDPIVKLSRSSIKFEAFKLCPEEADAMQSQSFNMTNMSPVMLGVLLDVEQPFYISLPESEQICSQVNLEMMPECSQEFLVWFNQNYDQTLQSQCVSKSVQISFRKHPHKDYISLQGSLYYSNLTFDRFAVDFGCILNYSEAVKCLNVCNPGPLPVTYCWSFDVDETKLCSDVPQMLISKDEGVEPVIDFTRSITPVKVLVIENKPFKKSKQLPEKVDKSCELKSSDQQSESKEDKLRNKLKSKSSEQINSPKKSSSVQDISSKLIDFLPNLVLSSNVEEAFHIEPMFGSLKAGESETVTIVYHGYPYLKCSTKVVCKVLQGPDYEVLLTGESSHISYEFNTQTIDFGDVHFNKVSKGMIQLCNTGKVAIKFKIIVKELKGKGPKIFPTTGCIGMDCTQIFLVDFCPKSPFEFQYKFEIQVAHFCPETFYIKGNALFPRIILDLPLNQEGPTHVEYSKWVVRAIEIVKCKCPPQESLCDEIQLEAERLMFSNHLDSLLSKRELTAANDQYKANFFLQDYLIDFGPLTLATIASKIVKVSNPWSLGVSFYVDDKAKKDLSMHGITINLTRICCLTQKCATNFEIIIDPRNSTFEVGHNKTDFSVHIHDGPDIKISVRYNKIMPSLCISESCLNFEEVLCGECKIITIQFFNEKEIECHWSLENSNVEEQYKCSREGSNEASYPIFDILPSQGMVEPRRTVNVQVKFTPRSEKNYRKQLVLLFVGSSIRQSIICIGLGVEKRIEIIEQQLEFGPILPNSEGSVRTLNIRNPTCIPLELYCLEMDEVYLQEEKALRLMDGYDNLNNLLLPPHQPGQGLPRDILKYYAELVQAYQQWRLGNFNCNNNNDNNNNDNDNNDNNNAKYGNLPNELRNVNETELRKFQEVYLREKMEDFITENPLMKALALSANVKLTKDDELDGIVIVVYGAPKSGKSSLSRVLATDYGVPVLNLDDVITEAMERRSTTSDFAAYEICHRDVKFEDECSQGESKSSTPRKDISFKSDNTKSKSEKSKDSEPGKHITLTNGTKLKITNLPEDIVAAIVKERLKHSDCLKGAIFDGLHSVFTESCRQSALCLLKAFGNRPFIYAIALKLSYESVKLKKIEASNYLDNQLKMQEAKTLAHLNEMSEDEFDGLSHSDKIEFNRRRREFKRSLLARKTATAAEKKQEEVKEGADKHKKDRRKGKGDKGRAKGEKKSKKKKQKLKSDSDDSSQYESDASKSTTTRHEDHSLVEESYSSFESEFRGICSVFESWDRSSGTSKASAVDDSDQNKKVKKHGGKDKKEKAVKSDPHADKVEETPAKDVVVNDGSSCIPHMCVNVSYQEFQSPYYKVMQCNCLPTPEQVSEFLGLTKHGPDILPPLNFSVVPYPVQRSRASNRDIDYFQFIDPSSLRSISESNEIVKETIRLIESLQNKLNSEKNLDEFYTSFYSNLKKRRWVLPALSEIALKIKFMAKQSVKASTSLNFKLVGKEKKYQIPLLGFCGFPTISKEPRVVFPACIAKSQGSNDIVMKKYIHSEELFEFGPLLKDKPRETPTGCIYAEDGVRLNIVNISPFESEVNFAFLNDENKELFFLHPPVMTLCPDETKALCIWAYPKSLGSLEDSLVCCVRNNPEPVVFKLRCQGVTPEVEVDPNLDFGGILIHKHESKALTLKNKTALPAAWKLKGLDDLGKEFSVSHDEGIINPHNCQDVSFLFRALSPDAVKKTIQLEMYDLDNIIGLIKVENIVITAEVYDLALDIGFPKGNSAGLDFGLNKVGEEHKQVCTLRNKGRYNISFKFVVSCENQYKAIKKCLTIDPISGLLSPTEKPAEVQFTFNSKKEVSATDLSILKCFVIDSKLSEENKEHIACIPIKITACSTWMKFKIIPAQCLNFGAMAVGERKTMQVVIQNIGHKFDLKFYILQKNQPLEIQKELSSSRESSPSREKVDKKKSKSALKKQAGKNKKTKPEKKKDEVKMQEKIEVGNYVLNPSYGSVEAHSQMSINVECFSDVPGKYDQMVVMHIPGIETKIGEETQGLPYLLLSEFCTPRIEIENESLIFEEHFIERNLLPQCFNFAKHLKGVGFYKQKEKRFIFKDAIIGTKACARFRIINIEKIPCNVTFTVKNVADSDYDGSTFMVSSSSCQIPPLESFYVDISFSPSSVKAYLSKFEAAVDNMKESLTFEIFGEGILPRIKILMPTQTDEFKNHILNFQRVQVNEEKFLAINIMNDGTLDCIVNAQLFDSEKAFTMCFGSGIVAKDNLTFSLAAGEMFNFLVSFMTGYPDKYKGQLKLRIFGNEYDENLIQLLAESSDEVVFLKIPPDSVDLQNKLPEMEGLSVLNFGECGVGEIRTMTFQMMSNPCNFTCLKFEWLPDHEALKFVPQKGHLRPGSHKDVRVTFASSLPVEISKQVTCNLTPITYDNECQLEDWDDGLKVVKWMSMPVSDAQSNNQASPPKTKLKTTETEPEPLHNEIGAMTALSLYVAADSQYCQYNMSSKDFVFKDTSLYQERTYSLKITNSGKGQLKFKWDSFMTVNKFESQCHDQTNSPFSISPVCGSILPGKSLEFSVTFLPKIVEEFSSKFLCNIQNLDPSFNNPELEVRGRCIMPDYYFQLDSSEYMNERNAKFLSPDVSLNRVEIFENFIYDRLLNVVEFQAVGICKAILKRFHIVNPTICNYFYEWVSFDPKEPQNSRFECYKPRDSVLSGKRSEITFAFTPNNVGIVESMWKFCIPEMNLVSKFLFVGKTRLPNVMFDRSHHNFGPVMIASKCQNSVLLQNHEDEEYSFLVDPHSCYDADRNEMIYMRPPKGVLPPRSNCEITFEYTASSEGKVNFNARFKIDRMIAPLNINVKAQAYSMRAKVSYEKQCQSKVALRSECLEEIDFGQVYLFDSSVINILIENFGSLGFDFAWKDRNLNKIEADNNLSSITVEPTSGFINQGEKSNCNLIFRPTKKMTLKNFFLILSINQSENYHIALKGSTKSTMLKFSRLCFNFGGRLVYEKGHEVPTEELIITNETDKPASINCLEQPDTWLWFSFEPRTINPCKSMTVKFKFYAREVAKYHRVIPFIINESVTQEIQFYGEGIQMKLEAKDSLVYLGPVCIGQCVRRTVSVCNGCSVPLEFSLKIQPVEKELLAPGTLCMQPMGPLIIAACSCFNVEIFFSPKKRITRFSECVVAEGDYFKKTLFVIDGSALGYKLELSSERIHFGVCVLGSTSTQSFIMSNTGDLGSKFHWGTQMLLPDFTISPLQGYIPPDSEVHFQATFNPREVNDEFCCRVRCLTDYYYVPQLFLCGSCIKRPSAKETINMHAIVRRQDKKDIEINNPTEHIWNVKPVVCGDYFSGIEAINVPPKSLKNYEITYHPLVMTDKCKHSGSVFLPIPNEVGIMYSLLGTSDPPEAEDKIVRNIPSKVYHIESLRVQNWLNRAQRFKVKFQNLLEPIKSASSKEVKDKGARNKDVKEKSPRNKDKKDKSSRNKETKDGSPRNKGVKDKSKFDDWFVLSGVDYIEVPALSTKEYKLSVFSHKEGSQQFKVMFKNVTSKEYVFYELLFTFTKPDVICCICLESIVRQKKQHDIVLHNPLKILATFSSKCTVEEINISQKMTIPGLMEKTFTVEYFPVKPGKSRGRLELNSEEMGSFIYDLDLRAIEGPPEKTLKFQTAIGSKQSVTAKFMNFAKTKLDYVCQVDHEDFICDKTVSAPSQGEVPIEITYEPSKVGTANSSMIVSSPGGGSYIFPLVAECSPPKPQGPFLVKSGKPTTINFKNVFKKPETFQFQVNNQAFKLNTYKETIQPQKGYEISVSLVGKASESYEAGKLVCQVVSNDPSELQWIYYLKGTYN